MRTVNLTCYFTRGYYKEINMKLMQLIIPPDPYINRYKGFPYPLKKSSLKSNFHVSN